MDDRLPTALWVDAHLRQCMQQGIGVYVTQKGAYAGGLVLLKLSNLEGQCRVLIQQRDLDGVLGWMDALSTECVEEPEADAYIKRSIDRDPDLWVIEIEDKAMKNPFDAQSS